MTFLFIHGVQCRKPWSWVITGHTCCVLIFLQAWWNWLPRIIFMNSGYISSRVKRWNYGVFWSCTRSKVSRLSRAQRENGCSLFSLVHALVAFLKACKFCVLCTFCCEPPLKWEVIIYSVHFPKRQNVFLVQSFVPCFVFIHVWLCQYPSIFSLYVYYDTA